MTRAQGRDGAVVLGLVAPSGVPRELAEQIAAELPGELGDRLGDVNWQVRVGDAERADVTPTTEALKRSVRRRMQDEGWDLAVGLTDLPLRANRRPVVAHASAMYRVGLLSVPALGARSVPQRAIGAVLNLVEGRGPWCWHTAYGSGRPGRKTAKPWSSSTSRRQRLWGLQCSRSTRACSRSASWVARASSRRPSTTAASDTHRRSPII